MPLRNAQLGAETVLAHPDLVNLYGCSVGDGTKVGPFVEIQKNSHVGVRCKISSHTFICEGATIEDEVFIGHGVMFANELFPRACTPEGRLKTEANWSVMPDAHPPRRFDRIECHNQLTGAPCQMRPG